MPALGSSLVHTLTLLSAIYQAAIATPVSSFPRLGRREITLSNESSCNDLSKYQTENGLTRIQADMYEMLEGHKQLDAYIFNSDGDITDYVNGFAAPYGVGQTYHCGIPQACGRINCKDMDDPDAPGTGAAYAILLSFSNFNLFLNALFDALQSSKNDWNGLQVKLQQTYWPYKAEPLLVRQMVIGITAVATMIAAGSGIVGAGTAAVAGGATSLLGGLLGGVNLAIAQTDQSLAQIAELETNTQVWYQAVYNEFVYANNNLTTLGWYNSDPPSGWGDIIENGAWVDNTDHPVLNDDASKPQIDVIALKKAFYSFLLGNMINFAWKEQGTFIVKYTMSQEEYDGRGDDWNAAGGDAAFRTYYGGSAFFLQRYENNLDTLLPAPQSARPPGVTEVGTDLGPCDSACVMQSSADGFEDHGFGYNFTDSADFYSGDQSTSLVALKNLPRERGFFNIPVCDLSRHERIKSADDLNGILEDQNWGYGMDGKKALWCYCLDQVDKNGSKFKDWVPAELKTLFEDVQNCEQGYW